MIIRNVWTLRSDNKVISYEVAYTPGGDIAENIANLHREIAYTFGGNTLDVSLDSNNTLGTRLSVARQKLDDKAVIDVCNELLSDSEGISGENMSEITAITFDWVYIQAIMQRFGQDIDLSDFSYFTDVRMQYGDVYSSARAVAEIKSLKKSANLDIINSFEEFSKWRVDNVLEIHEVQCVEDDYRIIFNAQNHISLVSRLPRNILSVVADSSGMHLWSESGKYILYTGCFDKAWLSDFFMNKVC